MRFQILTVAGIIFLVLFSCLEKEDFSYIPNLEFEEIFQQGNDVVVKFKFTDGDGDIGLRDIELDYPYGDCHPFNKNLIVDPYYLENGEYILGRFVRESDCPDREYDTLGFDQRIRYIVPEGKDKTLQGEIYVTLNDAVIILPDDTVIFKIRLLDRMLNVSNEIQTTPIITPPI